MRKLGGLGFSQTAVLASGFSSDDWPAQFSVIPATKSLKIWCEDKGVLIASWHRFKGLEADAIVTIETPDRDDAREWVNRYVALSRATYLLTVIEVEQALAALSISCGPVKQFPLAQVFDFQAYARPRD